MKINYHRFYSDAYMPTHNNKGDAGLDFYSIEYYPIQPHSYQVIRTGVAVQLPEGYVGLLFPKGKNDHLLGAGVIDTYYEGEILFKIVNFTDKVMEVNHGDAIGQMIIVPFIEPEPVEGWSKRNSERGDGGGIKKSLGIKTKIVINGDPDSFVSDADLENLEKFTKEEVDRVLDLSQYL